MLLGVALARGSALLSRVSDSPHLDSQWLLLHALSQHDPPSPSVSSGEASWLFAHDDFVLTAEQEQFFFDLVEQRVTGKPLAYLLGYWEFYGRRFVVTEDVLVPRPSTETLVDAALDVLARLVQEHGERPLVVADIGTGSGCVAITLLLESRIMNLELRIVATDISASALAVARRNAELHGVADQIMFLQGDMLVPLSNSYVDLIVSNPPYAPSTEFTDVHQFPRTRDTLSLDFEPRIALDGGSDGGDYVRRLQRQPIPAVVECTGGTVQMFGLS